MKSIRPHQRMWATARKRGIVLGLLPLVAAAVLVFALPSGSSASSASVGGIPCTFGPSFSLETNTGHVSTPDGNSVFMWGFKLAGEAFQMPGPVLCVTEGDSVSVTLENPAVPEPVSIMFPGQTGVTAGISGSCPSPEDCLLVSKAADTGGDVTYTFTASEPGTYLYQSGTRPDKQVQMGLYGALIVYPTPAGQAYDDPATTFSAEHLILLGGIDLELHQAVELGQDFDTNDRNQKYWQVNGRSFPDTIAPPGAPWLPNQPYDALVEIEPYDPGTNPDPILIRYLNASWDNHPFHPHGNHMRVIARDGRLLRGPGAEDLAFENFTRTLGSGQTYDLLFTWKDVEGWDATSNPVPVTIPGLQNLVFKDDVTFYSGSPYLGDQDELPVGVTSYNECGEFYFPWHSHALNEFTNFDEGFGGMATLLRVDQPGGC